MNMRQILEKAARGHDTVEVGPLVYPRGDLIGVAWP